MRLLTLICILFHLTPVKAEQPEKKHWSLLPVQRIPVPSLQDQSTNRNNPIDLFILPRRGAMNNETDRGSLLRRVTFDLTGLPPTPEEVEAARNDQREDWYERVVERLLASPRYGERWGRHWLDVVRFAESEGFEYDRPVLGAWRYRDYVIDSFNRDKPYNRFLVEQVAGDEIEPENSTMQIAVGLHRLGPVRRNAGNQELAFSRHEVLTEITDLVGSAILALTVGCARCHDHKFDDIPQADYYHLQAFFAGTQEHDVSLVSSKEREAWKAKHDPIQREIKRLRETQPNLPPEKRETIELKIRDLEKELPAPLPGISSVRNVEAERTPIHILKRGNTEKKDRKVGPKFLSALSSSEEMPADMVKPRTALARWLTSPDHPLTARVMVNRIWQYHFGRGLVETTNDFGVNGSKPTHPELLDWLARRFVESDWSIKEMNRLIVLSAAYRSSTFPRRRLGAEEVRDAMLKIAGQLNETMKGPSVVIPVDDDLVNLLYAPTQWRVTPDHREHDRRSVYLIVKRNLRLPFMEAFDLPDAQTSCGKREASTHALQSLEMLNGKLANRLAESLAKRLREEAGPDPSRQVELAFLLVTGRSPNAQEKDIALTFLKSHSKREFTLALFNLNAFLNVK